MNQSVHLQYLLGVDKKNPHFSLLKDTIAKTIFVYFGAALLEVIADDSAHVQFKLMIARLYNSGTNRKKLQASFGIDIKTMKRWGDALKGGDSEKLARALSGQGAPRKLTTEILAFIRIRFKDIYAESHYKYSKMMREEIKQVFNVSISGETLRPIFNDLKNEINSSTGANTCDLPQMQLEDEKIYNADLVVDRESSELPEENDNRKYSPFFYVNEEPVLCNYAGLLIFSEYINRANKYLGEDVKMIRQWMSGILLGAVNIEQTKLLDFNSLEAMLGKARRSLNLQRTALSMLSEQETAKNLLVYNAELTQVKTCLDFYYDPHTKRYTGMKKILKGWCAKVRLADKIMNMDFIHTSAGAPVYIEHTDNFHDLRERITKTTREFRKTTGILEDKEITMILDRGIYKIELFQNIKKDHVSIITWEKGYKRDGWDQSKTHKSFTLFRVRNNNNDLRKYEFQYMEEEWEKDKSMQRIIVRATNPKGNSIEVSIINTNPQKDTREVIELMFGRWIQENDFKYTDVHFGINEITSYEASAYNEIKSTIEDKEMKSGELKALELRQKTDMAKLGKILASEEVSGKKQKKSDPEKAKLLKEIKETKIEISSIQKSVSRLAATIKNDFMRLRTDKKALMDAIKITTRNIFYLALESFKEKYNNYRDDHKIFRSLTRAHGCIIFGEKVVQAILHPTMCFPPKLRTIIEQLLMELNEKKIQMPDGSGRTIWLSLSKKEGRLLAIVKG